MNVKSSKGTVIFVATAGDLSNNNQCPRIIASVKAVKFKDDYNGRVLISKKLTKTLFA